MAEMFALENIVALAMLTLLQAVLGFDNLLYISLESKRAPAADQARVRRLGIGIAIGFRIILLVVLVQMLQYFQAAIFSIDLTGIIEGEFNLHSLIVLAGGAFIIYTAMKEILHMMALEEAAHEDRSAKSVAQVVTLIVSMNLVFSFDSILSAIALTDTFWVMATAIVISGALMIWLSDHVAEFLQRNRMYEVLGLFILFVVGIMLLTEGGHLGHLRLMGNEIVPMTKTTFYFVITVLVLTDVVQTRYQRKLLRLKQAALRATEAKGS